MPRFKPLNYQYSSMVVINYLDQLQAGTFEHALHHLIESKLDLSVFYHKCQNNVTGRPAYDPAVLLKIILFAYSKGIIILLIVNAWQRYNAGPVAIILFNPQHRKA